MPRNRPIIERKCKICGKMFVPNTHFREVCGVECRDAYREERKALAMKIRREARASGKSIKAQRQLTAIHAFRNKNMLAIAEDALEADRMGISYGYYSARRDKDDM